MGLEERSLLYLDLENVARNEEWRKNFTDIAGVKMSDVKGSERLIPT
jgi:hypothetical protein